MSSAWADIKMDINANAHFGSEKDNLIATTQNSDNGTYSLEGDMVKVNIKSSISKTSPKLINLKVETYKKINNNFILWNTSEVSTESGRNADLKLTKDKDSVSVSIAPTTI